MLKSVIRGTVSLNLSGKGLQDKEQRIGPVIAGILTSLSNPYWILWWATVGLGYLTIAKHLGWVGLMTFFTGHVLADFCWYGAVSFAVAKGRKLMSDKVYKGIISVCGAFLLFIALTFIKDGVLKILI